MILLRVIKYFLEFHSSKPSSIVVCSVYTYNRNASPRSELMLLLYRMQRTCSTYTCAIPVYMKSPVEYRNNRSLNFKWQFSPLKKKKDTWRDVFEWGRIITIVFWSFFFRVSTIFNFILKKKWVYYFIVLWSFRICVTWLLF